MAKDKRSGMDYYEYKRRQEALRSRANPAAEARPVASVAPAPHPEEKENTAPRKAHLMGNVKKLVGGFGGRMDENPEDFAPEPEEASAVISRKEPAPRAEPEVPDAPEAADVPEPADAQEILDVPEAPNASEPSDGMRIQDVTGHILSPRAAQPADPADTYEDDAPEADEEEEAPRGRRSRQGSPEGSGSRVS